MIFRRADLESTYCLHLLKVLKLIIQRHSNEYKIINLSERRYDLLQLNEPDRVRFILFWWLNLYYTEIYGFIKP